MKDHGVLTYETRAQYPHRLIYRRNKRYVGKKPPCTFIYENIL